MGQVTFDEETGRQLEALYRIGDAARRRRLVRGALAATAGERILDLGCGPGFYCAELLEDVGPNGSIMGLDNSPQMLALAERRCKSHENVTFKEADATSRPVDDASVDGAVCVQVLEYVPDVAAGLSELYRVLRPGGRVVVWDEHLAHPSLPRTLAAAMRSAGFAEVTMDAHSFATAEFDPETYGVAGISLRRISVKPQVRA